MGYLGATQYAIYLNDSTIPIIQGSLQRVYGPQIINFPQSATANKLEFRILGPSGVSWQNTWTSEIQIFSEPPTQDKLLARRTNFTTPEWRYQYFPSSNLVRFLIRNQPSGYTNWNVKLCNYDPSPVTTPEAITELSGTFPMNVSQGASMPVPDLEPGGYMLLLTMTGTGRDPIVEDRFFARTESEWETEGAELGTTEVLLPGFTPLTRSSNTVNAVLRNYTQNSIGLWSQVESQGRDLLTAPIRVEVSHGTSVSTATGSGATFTTTSSLNVSGNASWTAGPISGSTEFKYEQDGLMFVTLKLQPSTTPISRLKVIIPLKPEEAYLYHSVGEGLRSNPAGSIPTGTGTVWSSYSVNNSLLLNQTFVPYVFVGGPERGICFAADNDKDWVPAFWQLPSGATTPPSVEIVRTSTSVELHLNIIRVNHTINRERVIKFALQATPAKEIISDWRKWSATLTAQNLSDTFINFWGADMFWGGDEYATSFTPLDNNYEYFEKLSEYRNTGQAQPAWQQTVLNRISGRPDFTNLRSHIESGWDLAKSARRGQSKRQTVFPYTNARGASWNRNKEFIETYIDEWMRWDITDPGWPTDNVFDRPRRTHTSFAGNSCWYEIEPVKSRVDFQLYYYKKMLETFADGIYCDGIFLRSSFVPDIAGGPGYIDDSGVIRAGVNITGFRSLFKRAAVMMEDMNLQPLIYCHMTNVNVVPILSFCRLNFDWDWRDSSEFAGKDLQTRMNRELILAMSTGGQAGNISVGAINRILKPAAGATREWLHRTAIASCYPHEIKLYEGTSDVKFVQEQLIAFGYGEPDCTVWRSWDSPLPVQFESVLAGDNVRINPLILSRNGQALVLVGNWSTGKSSYTVRMTVNSSALGLPSNIDAVDIEVANSRTIFKNPQGTTINRTQFLNKTSSSVFEFPIVHNDFALIKLQAAPVIDTPPPPPPVEDSPEPVNLFLKSEEFQLNPPWTGDNFTVTSNTTPSPTGVVSADTYTEGAATTNNSNIRQIVTNTSSSANYAVSIYVQRSNTNWYRLSLTDANNTANGIIAYFNLSTGAAGQSRAIGSGTLVNSGIVSLPDNWYRIWIAGSIGSGNSVRAFLHSTTGDNVNTRVGNSSVNLWGAMLDRSSQLRTYVPTSDLPPLPQPENTMTQSFNTAQTTADGGWVGNNNTSGGNNFGWNSTNIVLGGSTGGAVGGIFARSSAYSWFADTQLGGTTSRTNTLRMAGSLRLANSNFDGIFYLGYFNQSALTTGSPPANFIGIQISEPSPVSTGPFRAIVQVVGSGGASSATINLNQNVRIDFDLVWRGNSNGSGTFSGTIAGQNVNIAVSSGSATFTAFGLLCGGFASARSSEVTGGCFFDNLVYRKIVSTSEPEPPAPTPPPPTVVEPPPATTAFTTRVNWLTGTFANSRPVNNRTGWATVIARLARNPNDAVALKDFVDFFKIADSGGKAIEGAFFPTGGAWVIQKYWDKFTPSERDLMLKVLQNLLNLLSHGTENHFFIRYTGAYVFTQIWPNATGWTDFVEWQRDNSGLALGNVKYKKTSAQFAAIVKSRLLSVLKTFYSKGFYENRSTNYQVLNITALHGLYTLVNDPQLKAAANAALTYVYTTLATSFFEGTTLASHARPWPDRRGEQQQNTIMNTFVQFSSWLEWAELMNMPSTTSASFPHRGQEAREWMVIPALSDWRPPALLASIAKGTGILPLTVRSVHPRFGEFATGRAADSTSTVHRESRFAISSAVYRYRIRNAVEERSGLEIVYKTRDKENTIVCHHPYWYAGGTYDSRYQSSAWLSRSSPFQQNAQHESTIISLFNIPNADPFKGRTRSDWEQYRKNFFDNLIKQAWIRYPKTIDEEVRTNNWIFLREGETYIAIRPWGSYTTDSSEFTDLTVVKSNGAKNAVIMDVATIEQFATFAQFRTAVLAAPLTVDLSGNPRVTYRNVKGKTLVAQFVGDNYSKDEISSIPTLSVNGASQQLADPDFDAARAVVKSGPISLVDNVLRINIPAGNLTVDWSGSTPIFNGLGPSDGGGTTSGGETPPSDGGGTTSGGDTGGTTSGGDTGGTTSGGDTGGTTSPSITANSIVQWGDSMTQELGSSRIVTALNDGRRVVNRGVGGQRSAEIAGRQSGLNTTCRVANDQIPASGAVAITSLSPTIARAMRNGLLVTIAGVTGTLKPVGTDIVNPIGYEFIRSTTGSAVTASGSQTITPVLTEVVGGQTFNLNNYTAILWLGRNGVGASGETDVTIYTKMIAKMTNPNKAVVILPIFNGGFTSESAGLSGYTSRMDRNANITAAFPNYYYDVRRDFIDGAKAWMQAKYPTEYARDWNLAFSGTRSDTGPNSDWDVLNDVPPRALRRDKIHLNAMGNDFLAELLANRVRQIEGTAVTSALVQDLSNQVNATQFAGEDHKYGYHLRHLPTVANAVVMEGPDRGFINLPVWRDTRFNVPGNARVLENHVSLAFFYTANKPWNVYRGNQALRARLEAVLEFLISPVNLTVTTGNVDGVTQSIGLLGSDKIKDAPQNNELAGSAFGVKALGETLLMLEQSRLAGGPTIDENLRQRVITATRLIIRTCLGWLNFKVSGSRFSNQYTGFWGGAMAFLIAHPDANLRQLLVARITKLADKNNPEKITFGGRTWNFTLTSPAGFHYENDGPEWGYVFNTHYANIAQVAKYERGSSLMNQIISMEESWIDWLSYNAVRDPSGSDYVLNRAIQSRIATYSGFQIEELVLADSIPMARAFARTSAEHQTREATLLQQLQNNWPNVGALSTYPPNPFTRGAEIFNWRPTASQRTAAIASLPYLARDRFAHQRVDDRRVFQSTFIRRPTYYAAFNAGSKVADAQRFGLGILWNPQMGSVLQTQRGTVAPWGSARVGEQPAEANNFVPVVKVNGTVMQAIARARDFPNGGTGTVTFEYPVLGGTKIVTFSGDRISVSVRASNEFVELIPLLVRETDTVTILTNAVRLRRGGRDFEIQFPSGVRVSTRGITGGSPPRTFSVLQVTLRATAAMDYTLIFR
jgi:hypothetical protein